MKVSDKKRFNVIGGGKNYLILDEYTNTSIGEFEDESLANVLCSLVNAAKPEQEAQLKLWSQNMGRLSA